MPSGTTAAFAHLPWRRVVRNGVLIGVVCWLHLVLFVVLMSMNPRLSRSDAHREGSEDIVLHVRLIQRRSVARSLSHARPDGPRAGALATLRPAVYAKKRPSESQTQPMPPSGPEPVPGAPSPAVTSLAEEADAFGDPSIRNALVGSTSAVRSRLPGGTDTKLSGTLRVVSPKSLRDRVKSIGDYMSCSKIEMARNRPGQLNVVQIADAYTAHGCKK